ncbi:MAG: hypothetical protein ACTS42_00020 [Candidatus Hodgkinia cicadicola]
MLTTTQNVPSVNKFIALRKLSSSERLLTAERQLPFIYLIKV